MLDSIRRFFQTRIQPEAESASEGRAEHALRLATAALLIEVSEADTRRDERQREAARRAVDVIFSLTPEESAELFALAEEETQRSISLYEFTRLIDQSFSASQKRHVVELLWRVAYTSGGIDPLEEHLIRKIAGLIHVPHRDFIEAKRAARQAGETRRAD
jgi:uncharacterized tellurite resistance protein B-like protein